jgi:hypothetical protein
MNSVAATYKVFGFPMQRQTARRKLVVLTYLVLAALCGGAVKLEQTSATGLAYAMYGAMAVALFVFGGSGTHGLVKAFINKPPRPGVVRLDLLQLHLEPVAPVATDETGWKNDERELSRRDLAHYLAYQPISLACLAMLALSSLALRGPRWVSQPIVLTLLFALAMVTVVLIITLPSAIILWTEPDMDLA